MDFEWDAEKAAANLAKHGLRFSFARRILADSALRVLDVSRLEDREARYKAVGEVRDRRYVVVYTLRGSTVRLISVRRANIGEERLYGDRQIHPRS